MTLYLVTALLTRRPANLGNFERFGSELSALEAVHSSKMRSSIQFPFSGGTPFGIRAVSGSRTLGFDGLDRGARLGLQNRALGSVALGLKL